MQLKIQIPRLILAAAFAGILLGCGGGSKEGDTDQNQSSGDKGNSKGGGNVAVDPANQPEATEFTPEMVKAAMEAALEQLPNLGTKEERAEQRAQVMEPEALQRLTDKLNKNISGGKIDHQGLKVDAITVQALTKAIVAELPKTNKSTDARKSTNNASQLTKGLFTYAISGMNEGNFPTSDKWCDAILRDMGTLAVFYSPQHPDTAKLKAALPKSAKPEGGSPEDAESSAPEPEDAPPPPGKTLSPSHCPRANESAITRLTR